jgi:hypothetical protein
MAVNARKALWALRDARHKLCRRRLHTLPLFGKTTIQWSAGQRPQPRDCATRIEFRP